jgi:O-antigen/teichoic acid export membrane protein
VARPDGRLARATVLNLVGMAIPLAVGIVILPFLVRALGVERFGLLSLVWVLLANLAVFDFGLARTTTKFVAESLASDDRASVPRLVWTVVTLQAIIGLVAAVAFAAASPMLIDVFDVPPSLRAEALTAFWFLASAIPFMLVGSCFTAVLEGTRRFDLLNAVTVPCGAATIAVPLIVVSLGGNLAAMVSALLAIRVAAALASFLLSIRALPMLRRVCVPSFAATAEMKSFAGWLALATFTAPLLKYLDRYVVATVLSVSAVAYYSAASDTIERLWIVSTAAVLTLFPAFTTFRANGASERTHAVFVLSVKALLIAVAPVALCLAAWAPVLLRLWLGAAFAEHGATAFQLLALAAPVAALTPVAAVALQAYGRPDVIAKLYILSVPINAGVVFALVAAMGVTGAALSMTVRALVEASFVLGIALRTLQLPVATFIEGVWRTAVLVGALAPLLWLAATALDDIGGQLAFAAIVLTVFGIAIWKWGLTAMERVHARALIVRSVR